MCVCVFVCDDDQVVLFCCLVIKHIRWTEVWIPVQGTGRETRQDNDVCVCKHTCMHQSAVVGVYFADVGDVASDWVL
jgi:hypothetical protein